MVNESYEKARKRVKELKGFYNHLITFIIINVFLATINIVTSPGNWWFYWITIIWGFGIAWHGASLYMNRGVFSKEWEEQKIKEYMEKED